MSISTALMGTLVPMAVSARRERREKEAAIIAKEKLAESTAKEKQALINKQAEDKDNQTVQAVDKLTDKLTGHLNAFDKHVESDERNFRALTESHVKIGERLVAVETTLVTQNKGQERMESKMDRLLEKHA